MLFKKSSYLDTGADFYSKKDRYKLKLSSINQRKILKINKNKLNKNQKIPKSDENL